MKSDYILGICFDSDDPQNLGRIRAVPISEVGSNTYLNGLRAYMGNQDTNAVNNGKYQPWYAIKTANFTERDPYICEPFLPKHIGVLPNPGQLVKIMRYDNVIAQEFIGPYTIDQITLTEEYRNVIRNLQKGLNISQVLPKKSKVFLSGYNNEQLMLGENEAIIRLAHINTDKTRKSTYPFIQLSQFNNSYNITAETVTSEKNNDIPINFIAELFIEYQPKVVYASEKNIVATLLLYDTSKIVNEQSKLGLTKKTYSGQKPYIVDKNTAYFVAKHVINTASVKDLDGIVNNIVESYKTDSKVAYYSGDTANTSDLQVINDITKDQTILIYNNLVNLPTAGGGTHDTPGVITGGLRNWIFRLTPNTQLSNYAGSLTKPNSTNQNDVMVINYNNFVALDSLINKYKTEQMFGNLRLTNQGQVTSTQDVAKQTGTPQSVHTAYADKFLFLSSLSSPGLINELSSDGFSAAKIAQILYGTNNQNIKTFAFMRGEPLMDLLNEVLTHLLDHGHESGVDPRSSLIQSSKENLSTKYL